MPSSLDWSLMARNRSLSGGRLSLYSMFSILRQPVAEAKLIDGLGPVECLNFRSFSPGTRDLLCLLRCTLWFLLPVAISFNDLLSDCGTQKKSPDIVWKWVRYRFFFFGQKLDHKLLSHDNPILPPPHHMVVEPRMNRHNLTFWGPTEGDKLWISISTFFYGLPTIYPIRGGVVQAQTSHRLFGLFVLGAGRHWAAVTKDIFETIRAAAAAG